MHNNSVMQWKPHFVKNQVRGKFSINHFHRPPGAIFWQFRNFPHPLRCPGGVENCQKTQSYSKIWLWKWLKNCVIFSEKLKKNQKIIKNTKKNIKNSDFFKNEAGYMFGLTYLFSRFYFLQFKFKNIATGETSQAITLFSLLWQF